MNKKVKIADSKLKTITIIIPCRNEEKYIARCLVSLLENDYPWELQDIVVVDGMSMDRTREILNEYSSKYKHIRFIDNPDKIKPIALNLGIKCTKSDVVMRIDAHSVYEKNYISKLITGLYQHNADNIGGIRETYSGDTNMAKTIAIGISHPFSVGNAYWRTFAEIMKAPLKQATDFPSHYFLFQTLQKYKNIFRRIATSA